MHIRIPTKRLMPTIASEVKRDTNDNVHNRDRIVSRRTIPTQKGFTTPKLNAICRDFVCEGGLRVSEVNQNDNKYSSNDTVDVCVADGARHSQIRWVVSSP